MNRLTLLLVALLLVISSGARAGSTAPSDLSAENERLRARVRELEDKVKELEHRLERVTPYRYPYPYSLTPIPSPAPVPQTRPPHPRRNPWRDFFVPDGRMPDGRNVPEDWVRKEFNGQPFYLIPLDDRSTNKSR
jgi:hypothetical protein